VGERFDLKLPDGTILRGIPEGTTKDQIAAKLRSSGMAVPQENTWLNAAKNVGEAALTAGTGIAGSVAGDVAGLGAIAVDSVGRLFGRDPGETADPSKVRDRVQGALTYEAENPQSLSSKIVSAPGRVLQAAGAGLGKAADEASGHTPYVGTLAEQIPTIAANLLGVRGAKAARTRAATEEVPTTPELHTAATRAYDEAREAGKGKAIPADSYAKTLDELHAKARDFGVDDTLTPKSAQVLKRLEEARGNPLTLDEAARLRAIASNAAGDVHPGSFKPTADATLAQKLVDHLDDSFDDVVGQGPAREVWSRYRRSDMLDEMKRRAEIKAGANYTQAGLEHALRGEFKTLALNAKKMKYLTPEMRAAVTKVAKGGVLENTLRNLGKLSPENGGLTGILTGGAGIAGAMAGHPAALAAIPVGFAAKRSATAMTKGNVAKARAAIVGRGLPGKSPPVVGKNVGAGQLAAGISVAAQDNPYLKALLERLRKPGE
jgi:hypothetical protein